MRVMQPFETLKKSAKSVKRRLKNKKKLHKNLSLIPIRNFLFIKCFTSGLHHEQN